MPPKPPSSVGQFAKLQDGENRYRFLSEVVYGWEGWKDKKPFRHEGMECKIKPEDVDKNSYGNLAISFFWAAVVWNYKEKKIQVLSLTQTTIMDVLYDYTQQEEFGDVHGYDIKINRNKEGDKVTYITTAMPPKPVAKEIAELYAGTDVNLKAIFRGEYPMGNHQDPIPEEDVPF